VAATIDVAKNLGLRTIAEGVEALEQLAVLRQLHCRQAHMYLFAHPLPAHDLGTATSQTPGAPPTR
jgi:EAL domain-containing protein (putative c-di-GMP-specific phosphodiesterase class I)